MTHSPHPFNIRRKPARKIRVRVFTKDGHYEYFRGGCIVELRYGYADLVSPKSYYHTWRAYGTFLGAHRI